MTIKEITTDDYFSDNFLYRIWFYVLKNNIYCEQTELVNDLIADGTGDFCPDDYSSAYINGYKDVFNLNIIGSGVDNIGVYREVLNTYMELLVIKEWRCITKKLAEMLRDNGEVVIDSRYGCWWGRLSLPPYEEDPVLLKIVEDLISNKISFGEVCWDVKEEI